MDRAETGRTGEAVAARYYQKQGCELVAHNYCTRMGEIDLILREPDGRAMRPPDLTLPR